MGLQSSPLTPELIDLRVSTVEHIPNSLVVYTDGSWAEDEPYAGIGVYFPQLSLRIACRLHGEVQNIERAETQAAVTALKIARHFASRYSSITLRTDSLNLMLFVKHFKGLWDLYCWETIREEVNVIKLIHKYFPAGDMIQYRDDFEDLFTQMDGLVVHWQKVKAHSDNLGNDVSDVLSKTGRKLPYDNRALYESLKSQLNLAPASSFDHTNRPPRYTSGLYNPNLNKILEIILVPLHIKDSTILGLFQGKAQILASKNMDKGATRDISLRVTADIFTRYMLKEKRQICLDPWIKCQVNPCLLQCGDCLALGQHSTKLCKSGRSRCGNCAEFGHTWKACPMTKAIVGTNKLVADTCANCKDQQRPSGHSAFSNSCPLRQKLQNDIVAKCLAGLLKKSL